MSDGIVEDIEIDGIEVYACFTTEQTVPTTVPEKTTVGMTVTPTTIAETTVTTTKTTATGKAFLNMPLLYIPSNNQANILSQQLLKQVLLSLPQPIQIECKKKSYTCIPFGQF